MTKSTHNSAARAVAEKVETARENPPQENVKTGAATTKTETPTASTKTETPAVSTKTETPAVSTKTETPTASTKTETTAEKTSENQTRLNIIKASAAVYRQQKAPEDRPCPASEEQQQLFADAQKSLALKSGLTPNENNEFDKELLDEKFGPEEVIKNLSFEHYKEADDREIAYQEVGETLQSAYENEDGNEEQKEEVPQELTSINDNLHNRTTFLTDQDFLSLNEDEQKKYLESIEDYGAEKDHLTKLLEELANDNSKQEQAANLKKANEDPKRDKPKLPELKRGNAKDIIDFMMNDIVLSSMDTIADKSINGAAHGLYWSIDTIEKYFKKRMEDAAAEKTSSESDSSENDSPETDLPENITSKEQLDGFLEYFDETKKEIEAFSEDASKCYENILNRNMVLEENGYIQNGEKHSYSELSSKSDEESYESLTQIRESLDNATLKILNNGLNPEDNEEVREALKNWYNQTNENKEKAARGEEPNQLEFPDVLKEHGLNEEGLNNSIAEAQETALVFEKMQKETDLFSANYAAYKAIEDSRAGKPYDEEAIDRYKNEGIQIMYLNYQNLYKGDKVADSPETMLEFSEKMYRYSKELYENGDNNAPSGNLFEREQKTIDDTKQLTLDEIIKQYQDKCKNDNNEQQLQETNDEIRALEGEKAGVDKERSSLEAIKNRCLTSSGNEDEKGNTSSGVEIEQGSTSSNEGVENEESSSGKGTPVQTPKGRER